MITLWTIVRNLTLSSEIVAFFLDQKFTGTVVFYNAPTPKSITRYEYKDQSTVFLNVRVQRNF
jgi:hypothetical protein